MNVTDIKRALIAKSEADPEFRDRLIADPRAAIEAAANTILPAEVEITVFEESPTSFCLVLPPTSEAELSDADLATVAGGAGESQTEKEKRNDEAGKGFVKFWDDAHRLFGLK